ncbi:hypothetical protein [Pseudodonghicola xiamenensis]|uniref:Asp/Glu/Hydantoin racemase n=1 Tax=Pseudodonghicola xiamenensis TaxID=337702 RepID=A0A8J3H8H7_9RHOB|nr:hypothetical protein [Pseudodonghicola xiamenensis]GHH00239.1 hypothetical protein GCM10010961_36770 [Pseudodonghicola xiamenensis]
MTDLTLIHTAEVHRTTFDDLAARLVPRARLAHILRPDWLVRAQTGIDADLEAEVTEAIRSASGPVLCSCSTLGPLAAEAGALRIDAPMMARAARIRGPVLLAYCLNSTRAPSVALLEAAFAAEGKAADIRLLDLRQLWPLFENGETRRFTQEIARQVSMALEAAPDIACAVLAQASMAGAAPHLETTVPVLSSPETALLHALGLE